MRLTPEVLEQADVKLNPSFEVEIDLRGNKFAAIENLGVTDNYYESIDLSDNEIAKLENFPLLTRLKTLFFNNNRIARIETGLEKSLPSLETLILTNNRIARLGDLNPLSTVKSLRCLSLLSNPVSKLKHYRLYVIHVLPFLKLLDFSKVKWKERLLARKIFEGEKGETLLSMLAESTTMATDSGPRVSGISRSKTQVQDAIRNAKSLEEVQKIEAALASGGSVEGSASGGEKNEPMETEQTGSASGGAETGGKGQPVGEAEEEASAGEASPAEAAEAEAGQGEGDGGAQGGDAMDCSDSASTSFVQIGALKGRPPIGKDSGAEDLGKFTMAELKEFVGNNFPDSVDDCKGKKKKQLVEFVAKLLSQ